MYIPRLLEAKVWLGQVQSTCLDPAAKAHQIPFGKDHQGMGWYCIMLCRSVPIAWFSRSSQESPSCLHRGCKSSHITFGMFSSCRALSPSGATGGTVRTSAAEGAAGGRAREVAEMQWRESFNRLTIFCRGTGLLNYSSCHYSSCLLVTDVAFCGNVKRLFLLHSAFCFFR